MLSVAYVFDVLGTPPVLGRAFTAEEDRTDPNLVIIGYALWQRQYAGEPSVVNRPILMNGIKYTILGVMPRDFAFLYREIDRSALALTGLGLAIGLLAAAVSRAMTMLYGVDAMGPATFAGVSVLL
jgi:hypothetical protein